ncbi:MAG: Fur family transcriptional regulator [Thermoanaerobaculia bacterium]
MRDERTILEEHGVQPSAQRVAVAEYVLHTDDHPSADQVWAEVKTSFPMISRATVYNTLHLFVEKGLLRELHLAEGKVVYDAKLEPHHHFIEEKSGRIHDVAWDRVQVCNLERLREYDVDDYQVVMRGKLRRT